MKQKKCDRCGKEIEEEIRRGVFESITDGILEIINTLSK